MRSGNTSICICMQWTLLKDVYKCMVWIYRVHKTVFHIIKACGSKSINLVNCLLDLQYCLLIELKLNIFETDSSRLFPSNFTVICVYIIMYIYIP